MEQETSFSSPVGPAIIAELRDVVKKAKAGDASVLPRLRQILDHHPVIYEHIGDLEKIVVRAWSELLAGDDPLTREAVNRKADALRADLAGDQPTAIEKLLIGQVVSSWIENSHAQCLSAEPARQSLAQAAFNLKRAESSQKRLLAAIRTLTTVRALVPQGLLPLKTLRIAEPDRETA